MSGRGGRRPGAGRPAVDPVTRFWAKTEKTDGGCWRWTDALNRDGYGRLRVGERKVMAYRFSWELHNGPIPEGMQIDHRCLNRACVNPSHLRPVTQFENMQNLAGPQSRTRTGFRGVHPVIRGGRVVSYRATVVLRGVTHYGGKFKTPEEAAEVARQLRNELFTHNELDRREIA